jgi:hypothetical protein
MPHDQHGCADLGTKIGSTVARTTTHPQRHITAVLPPFLSRFFLTTPPGRRKPPINGGFLAVTVGFEPKEVRSFSFLLDRKRRNLAVSSLGESLLDPIRSG